MLQESAADLVFLDVLSLHKADGRVFHGVKARVAGNKIDVLGASLPVEVGDRLIRILPNGLQDEYVVDEYQFLPAFEHELPARFYLTVRRASNARASLDSLARVEKDDGVWGSKQALVTSPAEPPEKEEPKKAKPGPRPNLELARRVLEIVYRIAGGSPLKDRLDEICEELDQQGIPTPKTWKKRGTKTWADAGALERDLAKKAIKHHLKLAHE